MAAADVVNLSGDQGSSHSLFADLIDENGQAISDQAIQSVRATLRDIDTGLESIINDRRDQEVWIGRTPSTGELTVDANGHLAFHMKPQDFPIFDDRLSVERHKLTLDVQYSSDQGIKRRLLPYRISVRNLMDISTPLSIAGRARIAVTARTATGVLP